MWLGKSCAKMRNQKIFFFTIVIALLSPNHSWALDDQATPASVAALPPLADAMQESKVGASPLETPAQQPGRLEEIEPASGEVSDALPDPAALPDVTKPVPGKSTVFALRNDGDMLGAILPSMPKMTQESIGVEPPLLDSEPNVAMPEAIATAKPPVDAPVVQNLNNPALQTKTDSVANTKTAPLPATTPAPEAASIAIPPKPPVDPQIAQIPNVKAEKTAAIDAAKTAETKPPVDDGVGLLGGPYLKFLNGNGGVISLAALPSSSPPDVTEPLYLSDAVAFSLKNNYEVLASQSKVKESSYNTIGAYSEYAPSIQVSGSQGPEYSAPAVINDSFGNRVLESTHPLRENNVTIRQPLIDLNIIADILAAHNSEDISEEEMRDTREATAFDTANVFLRVIQAHIAIELANQYKSYLDNLSSRMTVRVEGGGGTKADLERIKGRSTIAESARVEAIGEYHSDLSEFIRLTKVVPAKLQIPDKLSPPLPDDIQAALDRAYVSNPAYRSSLQKIDAAVDERNRNVSGLVPKLALQYNHNFTYDSGGSAQGNPVDGVFPDQTTNSLLLVASWSISGGSEIAAGFSGTEKEKGMQLKAQDVRARLEQSIRTSYEAVGAAHARIAILQETVKADTRVVHDFELQFKEGNRTLFDLLDAYEQLYNARLNLMRLVIAEAQASLQIRRQMGDLVEAIKIVGER